MSVDKNISVEPQLLRGSWGEIRKKLAGRKIHLFLDFDGTLTPVRKRPDMAKLSTEVSSILADLAIHMPLAIVSGRDRDDVTALVGTEGLFYAGCHGFDINDPRVPSLPVLEGQCTREDITGLGSVVAEAIAGFSDVVLKVKAWAIAIHYRSASAKEARSLESVLLKLIKPLSQFRISQGDRVLEIVPNVRWDKGEAVLWLREQFEKQYGRGEAIYIGDDTSDEDAFRALKDNGITILVADTHRATAAAYRLLNPKDVAWFLSELLLLVRST